MDSLAPAYVRGLFSSSKYNDVRRCYIILTGLDEIPRLSRATQGVRVMKLYEGDTVASFVTFEGAE